jgi:ribosome silencing factor RsfS/YbeB/iojap
MLPPMDSKRLALLCRELAYSKKAEDLVVLDMRALTTVTDYFVICTGTSEPHLRAIVNAITDPLREEHHLRPRAIDGSLAAAWIVLDYLDVMIHVMRADTRERYNLEGLWGDAPKLKTRRSPGARPKTARNIASPKSMPPHPPLTD